MIVNEDGHKYSLCPVGEGEPQEITFIKRNSGCVTHDCEHPGTNTQEIIRVAIHRSKYLNNVLPCMETWEAIGHLRKALYLYELRAWRRKNQKMNRGEENHESEGEPPFKEQNIEYRGTCPSCGHICCDECG